MFNFSWHCALPRFLISVSLTSLNSPSRMTALFSKQRTIVIFQWGFKILWKKLDIAQFEKKIIIKNYIITNMLICRTQSTLICGTDIIIDRVALTKHGDNGHCSIRLSVSPSVCPSLSSLTVEPFDFGFADCNKEESRVIISPRCLPVCWIITLMWSIGF